jgi:antitoxin FitA
MADLLVRNIPAALKRQLKERARKNRQSMSEEAKALIRKGLDTAQPEIDMGTWMRSLVPPEHRSDEFVFKYPGEISKPPDFE